MVVMNKVRLNYEKESARRDGAGARQADAPALRAARFATARPTVRRAGAAGAGSESKRKTIRGGHRQKNASRRIFNFQPFLF